MQADAQLRNRRPTHRWTVCIAAVLQALDLSARHTAIGEEHLRLLAFSDINSEEKQEIE